MAPMGKRKAHASDAVTAWATRALCLSMKGEEKVLIDPVRKFPPDCELLGEEVEPPKFPLPPAHWGEAMTEETKKRTRDRRADCILSG